MSWPNIRLIFFREMRDQLRDRRTLFMIAVLPILFYPLLGVCFFQIAQFMKDQESRVLVVGEANVKEIPGLFDGDTFSAQLTEAQVHVTFVLLDDIPLYARNKQAFQQPDGPPPKLAKKLEDELRRTMTDEKCHAVLYYPPGVATRIAQYPERVKEHAKADDPTQEAPSLETPIVIGHNRTEEAAVTVVRLRDVTKNHNQRTREKAAARIDARDLAVGKEPQTLLGAGYKKRINASLWSKVLPFVLMIWAVTGAFYPAVDLCAGEKERGTLETLLSSPAQRSEIVMGKLFTVTIFSIATAMLNLLVMFGTGAIVLTKIPDLAKMANVGPPPLDALGWSILVIIPVAILVSAVCLALAALAKSTKEGQHYLAPVMLVALPLTLLPMAPQVELNFPFSLVPISGIVLLMRSLMEGTIVELWPYAINVVVVTFFCCWWSVRWAVEQFNSEAVLFREGERWTFGGWIHQLARDRQPTPTVAQALLCGLVILIVKFFLTVALADSAANLTTFQDLFKQAFISIVVMVGVPALMMTLILTRHPRRTLLLEEAPRLLLTIPVAIVLALAVLPLAHLLQIGITTVFPLSEQMEEQLKKIPDLLKMAPNIWIALIPIALLPAVVEEFAFRGFILSGFRHTGRKWRAIVLTSIFFALAHSIMQQEINALILGLLLGYMAIQTGSIWPCILFHLVYNSSSVLLLPDYSEFVSTRPIIWALFVAGSVAVTCLLLYGLQRLPYRRTREEDLVEAIRRESNQPLPSEASA